MQSDHSRLPIARSIDVLLTLTLAYHVVAWWYYPSLTGKTLGVLAIAVVTNDWLTTRSTYDFYGTDVLIVDLIVVFILSGIPSALVEPRNAGVARFWLLLGVCEILYLGWDLVIRSRSSQPDARRSFTRWTGASAAGAALYMVIAASHRADGLHEAAGWLNAIGVGYATSMLVVWNLQRLRRNASVGQSFLD